MIQVMTTKWLLGVVYVTLSARSMTSSKLIEGSPVQVSPHSTVIIRGTAEWGETGLSLHKLSYIFIYVIMITGS